METKITTRWEQGGDMLTPSGTVEIHSDEGDVIGFVYPKHADMVQAAPALLAALEAVRLWLTAPAMEYIDDVRANLDAAIESARGT